MVNPHLAFAFFTRGQNPVGAIGAIGDDAAAAG